MTTLELSKEKNQVRDVGAANHDEVGETCLLHLLSEKTVLFITHQLEFLDAADLVLKSVFAVGMICCEEEGRLKEKPVLLQSRYVMRCVFGDPNKAPPPLERLSPEAAVSFLWKAEGSLVDELIQCMAPHMDDSMLNDLKSKIRAHDPSGSDDIQKELRRSLIWLRDEVRNLPCTYKCRHDAAADLIHIYAHTKCFFRVKEYTAVTSPPVSISPLDLGPKYTDKLGSGFQEYRKTFGENYCLGQLIYWHNQTSAAEPDSSLARAIRGCLSLPDIGSFYAKAQRPSRHHVYGPRTVKFMLARMIIAAGPFTTTDNLFFEPLTELLAYARRKQPQLLLLLGPFIDSEHPEIKKGAVNRTFDEIFRLEILGRLQDYVEYMGSAARVILVPSIRDANHDFVFPQPAFDIQQADLKHQITSLTNPGIFSANEIKVGCCTVDILKQLSGEEISQNPSGGSKQRMNRLANHLLSQHSFYPLYPPMEDTPVDFSLAPEALQIPCNLDILILSSDLAHFVKVLSIGDKNDGEEQTRDLS